MSASAKVSFSWVTAVMHLNAKQWSVGCGLRLISSLLGHGGLITGFTGHIPNLSCEIIQLSQPPVGPEEQAGDLDSCRRHPWGSRKISMSTCAKKTTHGQ